MPARNDLAEWGGSFDSFELVEPPDEAAGGWVARARMTALTRELEVTIAQDANDPRIRLRAEISLTPAQSQGVAAAELDLGNVCTGIERSRSATLSCKAPSSDAFALEATIYEDGFDRHSLNSAVLEIARAVESLDALLESVADTNSVYAELVRTQRSDAELQALLKQAAVDVVASGQQQVEATQAYAATETDHPSTASWSPTHVVPASGMAAWGNPDPASPAIAQLDPGLDVLLVDRHGDWAQVRASNGWTGWVDGRLLVAR